MQKKRILFFSFPSTSNFGDSQSYEKASEMQKKSGLHTFL